MPFRLYGYFLYLLRDSRFGAVELMLIHTAYRYDPLPADPARGRMDSVHRCGVAFLFKSNAMRRKDVFYIFFSNGYLRITGRIRQDFPKGVGAAWSRPFLQAVAKQGRGSLFTPYPAARGFEDAFVGLLENGRLYLAMDGSGVCMSRYLRPSPAALDRCPGSVTYVIGGPLGYRPHDFCDIMRLIQKKAPSHAFAVQLPGDIQFASTVVSYLQVCNDTGTLRPDAAANFYMERDGSPDGNEVKWISKYRPRFSGERTPPRPICMCTYGKWTSGPPRFLFP